GLRSGAGLRGLGSNPRWPVIRRTRGISGLGLVDSHAGLLRRGKYVTQPRTHGPGSSSRHPVDALPGPGGSLTRPKGKRSIMTAMSQRRQASGETVNHADTDLGHAELLRDADRRAAWMLLVDGVPQSHVDLDDPGYLDFEYVRRLGHVIDTAAAQPLRVLHLGAGALTLARYVAATRPGSSQLAVEVDAALADLVRRRLPLDAKVRV